MSSLTMNPPEAPATKPALNGNVNEAWKKFLQGKDNPFDVFVMPRKSDDTTLTFFAPEVIKDTWDRLLAIVKKYRPAKIETEKDIPYSGIVVIEASRGNGKTHTMHALQRYQDPSDIRVVVSPTILDSDRPFHEFLLLELLRHLQDQSERGEKNALDAIAQALAKRVLLEGLRGESQVRWLARNGRGRRVDFWLSFLGWRTNDIVQRRMKLIEELEKTNWHSISDICHRNEVPARLLSEICIDHIESTHAVESIGQSIRRSFYCALVRRAFGGSFDELFEYLSDGFAQSPVTTSPPRDRMVQELFLAMIELFMLAKVPIIFAFDSLESLLHEPPDPQLCQYFFQGMADFVDTTRGIPFLVFAETGHWIEAAKYRSQYASHRIEQGIVGVPNYGTISQLQLPTVTPQRVLRIVNSRLLPLYREFKNDAAENGPVPPLFAQSDFDVLKDSALRNCLQRIRAVYAARIHNENLVSDEPVAAPPVRPNIEQKLTPAVNYTTPAEPCAALTDQLQSIWKASQTEAKTILAKLQTTHLQRLHLGVKIWLKALAAEDQSLGIGEIENDSSGAIPFGWLTRFALGLGASRRRIAIGFFIGSGVNMPRDLKAKLEMLVAGRQAETIDHMILLWPRKPTAIPADDLPPGSRAVWDAFGEAKHVTLHCVDGATFIQWMAVPQWDTTVRAEVNEVADKNLTAFVVEQTKSLLKWIQPAS